MGVTRPAPRARQARSDLMRARILEATVACLIDLGYARSSTWEICKRAGISRGALLHHFPTRLSVFEAAVEELAQTRLDEMRSTLENLSDQNAVLAFMDWLWRTLDGPLFFVGLELVNAARTEPELRAHLRRGADALSDDLDTIAAQLAARAATEQQAALNTMLIMSIVMVRGIGLDLAIGGNRETHAQRFLAWRALVAGFAR